MNTMTVRDRRLRNTYVRMKELAEQCRSVDTSRGPRPRFEFTHNGDIDAGEYPDIYQVTIRVTGMESRLHKKRLEHTFTIFLPATYPTEPPVIQWHTPIFHPNILKFEETEEYRELCREYGGEDRLLHQIDTDPRWTKLLHGRVCLDTLRGNWTPRVKLTDLVIEIANMVRYQTYTVNDAYNEAAAEWAADQERTPGALPLDEGLLEMEEAPGVRTIDLEDEA